METTLPSKLLVEFPIPKFADSDLREDFRATDGESWNADETVTIEDGEGFHRTYRLRNEHSGQEFTVTLRMLQSESVRRREQVAVYLGFQFRESVG